MHEQIWDREKQEFDNESFEIVQYTSDKIQLIFMKYMLFILKHNGLIVNF